MKFTSDSENYWESQSDIKLIKMSIGINWYKIWCQNYTMEAEKSILWRKSTHSKKLRFISIIILNRNDGHRQKKFISQVQKVIWDFMWEEKRCMVKPEVCMLPKIKGGLDIPCFDALRKVRRLKMLINVLEHPGPWFTLALRHLQCLDDKYGIPYFALQSDNSEKEVNDTNVSQLYKECLLVFRELCQKGKVIHAPNMVIWNYYGAIVRSHLMGCSWNINIGRNVEW